MTKKRALPLFLLTSLFLCLALFTSHTAYADDTAPASPEAVTSVDLILEKTTTGYFEYDGVGTFLLDVTNVGGTIAPPPITIEDTLPAGMTYLSAGPAPWSCTAVGSAVTCIYPDAIAPGESAPTLLINVQIGAVVTPVQNCAYVTVAGEITPNNNYDCVVVDITQSSTTSDLGDAPDSTNHGGAWMSTYWWPSAIARFPTVFDPTTGTPSGPMHMQAEKGAWLGAVVSTEREADTMPFVDQDGVTNIRDPFNNAQNRDNFDDGVHLDTVNLPSCWVTNFKYDANVVNGSGPRVMNTWIDFNRDGDFEDRVPCTLVWGPWEWTVWVSEWVIQNESVILDDGFNSGLTSVPFFSARHSGFYGDEGWMRVSLTPQGELAPPVAVLSGSDGRGPINGYTMGETEDYFLYHPLTIVTTTPAGVATFSVQQTNGLSGTVGVPANAVPQTVNMAYIPTSPYIGGALGAGYAGLGFELVVDASAAAGSRDNWQGWPPYKFNGTIDLDIPYTPGQTGGFAAGSMTVYEQVGMTWRPLSCGSAVDMPNESKVKVELCGSGHYALFGSAESQPPAVSLPEQLPANADGSIDLPLSMVTNGRDYSIARFTMTASDTAWCCDNDCDGDTDRAACDIPVVISDDDCDGLAGSICIVAGGDVSMTVSAENSQLHFAVQGFPTIPDGHVTVLKLRGPDRAARQVMSGFGIGAVIFTDAAGADTAGVGETSELMTIDPATLSNCDLQATLSTSGNFSYSGTGTYQLQVGNSGSAACDGLTVAGSLPDGVTLEQQAGARSGWTCAATAGDSPAFLCTSDETVAAGGSATALDLAFALPAASGGAGWSGDELMQCARVGGSAESDTDNNESCASIILAPTSPTATGLQSATANASNTLVLTLVGLLTMLLSSVGILYRRQK